MQRGLKVCRCKAPDGKGEAEDPMLSSRAVPGTGWRQARPGWRVRRRGRPASS